MASLSPSKRSPPNTPHMAAQPFPAVVPPMMVDRRISYAQEASDGAQSSSVRAPAAAQKSTGRPGLTYEAVQKLGEGAFGVAHLVKDKNTGQLRVLKTINKRRSQVPPAQLEREIRNMKACDHPHIVRFFEYYEDYENIYLIMERAAGGELHQVLQEQRGKERHLPERWVATVMKQCLQAITYVHSMGIIHKDLKSENILLLFECNVNDPKSIPHAVIIDLGIAELFTARLGRRARCSVVAGTPTHMAPEVWCGNFGQVADVWSLGIVLFELLAGEVPFLCSSLNSAAEWVRLHKQGPNWLLVAHTSLQARSICQRMLNSDERMRPTAQQCLGHAWFKETDNLGDAQDPTATSAGGRDAEVEEAPAASESFGLARPESVSAAYADRSKFEKSVMLQVASTEHTEQVSKVAFAFLSADVNRTGCIHMELLEQKLFELGVDRVTADAYVRCCEADSQGRIDYTELATGCIDLLYESLRGLLWQSFCEIDVEGNGVLGPPEVRAVVIRLDLTGHGFPGADGSSQSLDEAINSIRVDVNGQISFDELCKHFLPVRPSFLPNTSLDQPDDRRRLNDHEFEQLLDQIEAASTDSARQSPSATSIGMQRFSNRSDSALSHLLAAAITPEPDVVLAQMAGPSMEEMGDVDEELSNLIAEMSG
mmetsp:Transcript_70795/g.124925  ORF Transcript_70795/g.124925 Transcript_70795/m.124925 type:complete len:654 (+) Transcript_70795:128-2089(+)